MDQANTKNDESAIKQPILSVMVTMYCPGDNELMVASVCPDDQR